MTGAAPVAARDPAVGPAAAATRLMFTGLVRWRLRDLRVRGAPPDLFASAAAPAASSPPRPYLWVANHHSWWDGFVASVPLWSAGRTVRTVVLDESLVRHAVLRRAGGLPAGRPRWALRTLRQGGVVIIFPEGELRPAGPLGPVRPGADWLARTAGASTLAVATRVLLRGHAAPEAYLLMRAVNERPAGETLAATLADLDAELAGSDPRAPLPGFEPLPPFARSLRR